SDDQGNIQVGLEYKNPPNGQMTVKVTSVIFRVQGDWTVQWMPEEAQPRPNLYGIRLVLDKAVELEDGYYLIGHLEWDDERIALATPGTGLYATDAQGNRLAFEELSFDVFSQLVPDFSNLRWQPWAYRLAGKTFQMPLTLHLEKVDVMLASPVALTLDLRPNGFRFDQAHLGSSYEIGLIPLDGLPQVSARLARVTYLRQGDLHGFDLAFEADARLSGISVQLAQGLREGTGQGRLLIESFFDAQSGYLIARSLADAEMNMPMMLQVTDIQVQGDWTVEWAGP
ncbi:MAG: hypothetical protein DDG59_10635, partial [Anaerolineae bacterium]